MICIHLIVLPVLFLNVSIGKLDMFYAQAKFHFLHEALSDFSKLQ